MKGRLLLVIIMLLTFATNTALPQTSVVNYDSPKTYTVGGISVSGIKFLNKQAIIDISGLKVGQKVTIPGDEVTRSIEKLWKQGMFSDVSISVVGTTPDDQVFLDIKLEERPKLNKVIYKGIRSGEKDDIAKKVNLLQGTKITEHTISKTKNIIAQHYYDKGFYNVDVRVNEVPDTNLQFVSNMVINIDKGHKVRISTIETEGDSAFTNQKIRKALKDTKQRRWWGFFKPSKFVRTKFEDDKKKLVKKYNQQGYRDARVLGDSVYRIDDRLVGVKLKVYEGHQYFFRNITWIGNEKYSSARLQTALDIKKGDLYDQNRMDDRLNNDKDAVSNIYMDDGYLFYHTLPREVSVINDSVDVEIMVVEGPQAYINRINISGNTRTNDHVPRRELYTTPGQLFRKSDIINSVRMLAQLGNFEPEQLNPTPIPDYINKTVDIEYPLVEKSNDMFELSAGWGGGYFVGRLGVSFNNFSTKNFFEKSSWRPLPGGDGQKLSLSFQSNGKYYQTYSISFQEPWLGGKKPTMFSVSFYYTDVNYSKYMTSSDYWKQWYEENMNYRMQVWGGAIGLGRRLTWPDNNFELYSELFFKRYKLKNYPYFEGFSANGLANETGIKVVFSRKTIDQIIYPRNGAQYSLSAEITPPYSKMNNKNYSTISDSLKWKWVEYHKYGFEAKNFTQLIRDCDLVLHTKVQFGLSCFYTRDLGYAPFQGYTMGGDGMNYYTYGKDVIGMRGYDSETISRGGNVYAKYTFELRYPVILSESATIYGLGFLEGGNCWKEVNQFRPFDVYRAAGAGVRVYLPMLGMLGLDWGWGFDAVPGETERSGSKLQFTLGQNF